MRLRRRGAVVPVTVQGLVDDLRRADAAGEGTDGGRAHLEGLTESPTARVRMQPREGEIVVLHAQYLLGTLIAFLERTGRSIDRDFLVPPATVYCVAVAERAADPDKDVADVRLGTHTYAMVRVERRIGHPLPVAQEELLASWLATCLRLRPVEEAAVLMGRRRARRRAKLFPELPAEIPDSVF